MSTTFDTLKNVIAKDFGADASVLTMASKLADAGLDSLAAMELMFTIEDTFGIKLDDSASTEIPATLGELVDLIESKLPAQAQAA